MMEDPREATRKLEQAATRHEYDYIDRLTDALAGGIEFVLRAHDCDCSLETGTLAFSCAKQLVPSLVLGIEAGARVAGLIGWQGAKTKRQRFGTTLITAAAQARGEVLGVLERREGVIKP